jgi:hypothetical protein
LTYPDIRQTTPAAHQNPQSTENNYSQNTPNDAALPSDHLNSVIQGRVQRDPPEDEGAAQQPASKVSAPKNAHDDHSFSTISYSTITTKNTNQSQKEDWSQVSHQDEDDVFLPIMPPANSQRTGQQAETDQGQQAETTEKVELPHDLLKKRRIKLIKSLHLH